MRKTMMLSLFVAMAVFLSSPAFARSMEGQYKAKEYSGMMDKEHSQCPIANKFAMKSRFLLDHKDDIGLTDDQVRSIKDLKLRTEKDDIRQLADMKALKLDIESKLMEDKVDIEGTSALIDKGSAAASTAAKSNLTAYAQLKAILTPDQITKMKTLHRQMEANESEE